MVETWGPLRHDQPMPIYCILVVAGTRSSASRRWVSPIVLISKARDAISLDSGKLEVGSEEGTSP